MSAAALTTPIPLLPVTAILDATVRRCPDRPALDFLGRKTSYAELARLVEVVHSHLH